MDIIKGIQIKVARVAAGMTHQDLADEAHVAISTIRRIEVEGEILSARIDTLDKIIKTLESKGVTFTCHEDSLVWEKQKDTKV